MLERKVEVYQNGGWVMCHPSEIKRGDLYRMYEPNGEPVLDEDGIHQRIAQKDAYQNEDGIWTVQYYEDV